MRKSSYDRGVGAFARGKATLALDQKRDLEPPELLDPNKSPVLDFANTFLTDHELASRQKRSVKTIRNQRGSGGGCPFVKFGSLVRYRLSDVIAWESKRTFSSTSDTHST